MTGDNGLGCSYMLQHRLPGQPLHKLWYSMNIEQKKCATRLITQALIDISSVTCGAAGIVGPRNTTLDLISDVKLLQYPFGGYKEEGSQSAERQTTLHWMLDLCKRWNAIESRHDGRCWHGMWDKFTMIIKKLH
jgi:hypothetical protein